MAGKVDAEKEGAIGWIVFDHPERRNALSDTMWSQLARAARSFAEDDEVRVVILRGAGMWPSSRARTYRSSPRRREVRPRRI